MDAPMLWSAFLGRFCKFQQPDYPRFGRVESVTSTDRRRGTILFSGGTVRGTGDLSIPLGSGGSGPALSP
jgi:hypothetical protein